jgi:hypothetical protein
MQNIIKKCNPPLIELSSKNTHHDFSINTKKKQKRWFQRCLNFSRGTNFRTTQYLCKLKSFFYLNCMHH